MKRTLILTALCLIAAAASAKTYTPTGRTGKAAAVEGQRPVRSRAIDSRGRGTTTRAASAKTYTLTSPDGRLRVEVSDSLSANFKMLREAARKADADAQCRQVFADSLAISPPACRLECGLFPIHR